MSGVTPSGRLWALARLNVTGAGPWGSVVGVAMSTTPFTQQPQRKQNASQLFDKQLLLDSI